MCGIIGYTGKNSAVPYLVDGLDKLEYRGYDSAGIATMEKNGINVIKTKGRLSVLKSLIAADARSLSCVGIGHTRWATHGEPSTVNSHPHLSESGLFAVVHNGIIENYKELKDGLIQQGFSFISQTDTEVVAHLLEKNYNGNLLETVLKTVKSLSGSYALCILCRDYPDTIVCTRLGSPLVIGKSNDGVFVASDALAIAEHTTSVFRPEAEEIAVISKDSIIFYGSGLNIIQKTAEQISFRNSDAQKSGYEHFMLKEIMEQPKAVKDTVESIIKNGRITFPQLTLSKEEIANIRNMHIVACGSAYHVGVCGKYIIEKLTGIPTHTDIASEFRYRNCPLNEKDLCIVISQSGETADTLAAMNKAKEKGVKVISLVNVEDSSISLLSDFSLHTKAGPEIAVATTKAYSAQLAVIYCLAVYLASHLESISEEKLQQYTKVILSLPSKIRETIAAVKDNAEKLSELFTEKEHAFFIGRGTDYAIALEGSLKLKEISYIHSEAYAAGELKHGTISLIENGTMVTALICDESVFAKTYSNIKEVKARNARILAITNKKHEKFTCDFDHSIIIPDSHELITPSLEVIPLQLLSYYTAKRRNCDIDKPRNLAKSVTVE